MQRNVLQRSVISFAILSFADFCNFQNVTSQFAIICETLIRTLSPSLYSSLHSYSPLSFQVLLFIELVRSTYKATSDCLKSQFSKQVWFKFSEHIQTKTNLQETRFSGVGRRRNQGENDVVGIRLVSLCGYSVVSICNAV